MWKNIWILQLKKNTYWQKTTKFCKAIIFQLKNKLIKKYIDSYIKN